MATKPAVLIVHGGYFFAKSFAPFEAELQAAGYATSCPQLPTCGDKAPAESKAGLAEDIAAVQTAARALKDAGHSITVLAHSYGGLVACGALTSDLFASKDASSGTRTGPGISHIIFLSCWLTTPGASFQDIVAKHGMGTKVALAFNADGTAYGTNTAETFYSDIFESDPERAKALAVDNTTHNFSIAGTPVEGAPWKEIPSTYVHCTEDLGIEYPLQKAMVEDIRNAGGKLEVLEIKSGHCPFFSRPKEVIAVIDGIAKK